MLGKKIYMLCNKMLDMRICTIGDGIVSNKIYVIIIKYLIRRNVW